jgi:hypothetical protein
MLTALYFGSERRKEIDPLLQEDAAEALIRLSKAFGSSNLLATVRNKFSFHYLSDHIEEILSLMVDSQELRIIGASSYDNTLYSFAENIVTYGILNKTDQPDPQAAMDVLIGSLVTVSGDLLNYSSHLLGAILYERLGDKLVEVANEREHFKVEANLEEFKMPFFFTRGS